MIRLPLSRPLSLLLCALLLCECNTFAGEQLPETSPGLTATTSPDSSSDTTGGSPPPDNRTDDDSTATYQNPVVTPVAADPTIIRAPDGTYYLYATQDAWADGDGWHYLPIFKSDNLVDWTFVRDALDGLPIWGGDDGYLWAPDVSRHEDTYYLYFSRIRPGEGPCIGLATADDPEGPWREIGRPVFCSGDVGVPNSIDPFVWYEDGTRTMIWGSFRGIYAVELNGNGTAPAGSKVQLADDRFEGAYVEKHGGSYYLFVSAGTCCEGANSTYEVQVGRSDSLTGPYVDKEGDDLRNGGGTRILDGTRTWVGPGHNSIATDDAGHDWMVYHAIPRDDPRLSNGINRRPTLIDRIRWEDGWPVINGGEGPTTTEQPPPEIETTGTGIEKPPEPR